MEEFDSTLLEQYFRLHRLLMHGLHERRGCARTAYSGQGRVLKLLRIKPEISQREMAEILGIRPQSLGETLNRLEAAGYIERRTREDDRRSLIVCLTEAGAEAARDERGQSSGDDGLFDCLSAAERSQLAALLAKVTASLESRLPPPPPPPEHGPHEHGCHGGRSGHHGGHGCCRHTRGED